MRRLLASFVSVVCLPYLMYFIHILRCIGNYTEMGAAITAVLLSFYHMARTAWGLIQLEAFKGWNVKALYVLSGIGYPAPIDGPEEECRTVTMLSMEECFKTIDRFMMVNSTLIDNTFFGAELPIRLT